MGSKTPIVYDPMGLIPADGSETEYTRVPEFEKGGDLYPVCNCSDAEMLDMAKSYGTIFIYQTIPKP